MFPYMYFVDENGQPLNNKYDWREILKDEPDDDYVDEEPADEYTIEMLGFDPDEEEY